MAEKSKTEAERLAELIQSKRAAGLSEADATEVAKRQLAHEAKLAKAAAKNG